MRPFFILLKLADAWVKRGDGRYRSRSEFPFVPLMSHISPIVVTYLLEEWDINAKDMGLYKVKMQPGCYPNATTALKHAINDERNICLDAALSPLLWYYFSCLILTLSLLYPCSILALSLLPRHFAKIVSGLRIPYFALGLLPHLVPDVIIGIKMGIRCKSGTIPVAVILPPPVGGCDFPVLIQATVRHLADGKVSRKSRKVRRPARCLNIIKRFRVKG
jgi:hypothetical protein